MSTEIQQELADSKGEVTELDVQQEQQLIQLRHFNSLSLREKLLAVEGMADVVRRLRQIKLEERKDDLAV